MQDIILQSIFLDVSLWREAIEHGLEKGTPREILHQIQDPHFRAGLCRKIAEGEYFIQPPRTGYRPKENGGERTFLANEPLDRLVLNIIYKWLLRNEPQMTHPSCLSYQEGIGVGKIVKELSQKISSLGRDCKIVGRKFDIHHYFESVSRDSIHKVLDAVELHNGKSSIIDLLRKYYDSDIYYDSRLKQIVNDYKGIKQGCAVSAWLANVILAPLDEAMYSLGGIYVRYSDDIIYIGHDYEKATNVISSHLHELGLSLNEKKMEDVRSNEFVRFLGYYIRGKEITLSRKWVKDFQKHIDSLTIRDMSLIRKVRSIRQKGGQNMEARLKDVLLKTTKRVIRFLYYGNGEYSWASLVLCVINRQDDINQLNLYCIDALRAVYTGKTSIGGLGISKQHGILRGKGKNVASNRRATSHLCSNGWVDGFFSINAMKKYLSNKWLCQTLTNHFLSLGDYPLYEGEENIKNTQTIKDEFENKYKDFRDSKPDGKKTDRFYARQLSSMNTIDLMLGENRTEARKKLYSFLHKEVNFAQLQDDPSHWYWQSKTYPELVVLKEWFSDNAE